jgi:hypothetical protein|tara:strand:+ start:429 stop:665 length:237 start_codon:yes stop_codon:yes gene_type:complete
MSGQFEKTLDSKPAAQQNLNSNSKIRVHLYNGEIHFHDDTAKLKVAIPVADFWRDWQKFSTNHFEDSLQSVNQDRFCA